MSITVPLEIEEREYALVEMLSASEGLTPAEFLATLLVEQMFTDRRFFKTVVQILRARGEMIGQVSTAGLVPLLTVFSALMADLTSRRPAFEQTWDTQGPVIATTELGDAAFTFLDALLSQGQL